jgi:hypothetical protein
MQRAPTPRKLLSASLVYYAGMLLVISSPYLAARWALGALGAAQQLLLAVGGLLICLVLIGASRRWTSIIVDGLAIACLCAALVVGSIPVIGAGRGLRNMVDVVLCVGLVLYLWRATSHLAGGSRPANVPEGEPVLFRSDGESIAVYPSRRKLAEIAALWGCLALGFLALLLLTSGSDGLSPLVGWVLFLLMVGYGVVPSLIRLLHTWPSLIVNSDGITDHASAQIFGFGLIPWHEIDGFSLQQRSRGRGVTRFVIYPVNYQRLIRRQPFLTRLLLQGFSSLERRQIVVSSRLLPDHPVPVFQRVHEFVLSHAPASYMEQSPSAVASDN